MQDTENLVGFVERVLYLKTLGDFEEIAPDRLTVIAEQLQERFYRPGEVMFRRGAFAEEFHFIVEGTVRIEDSGAVRRRGPRQVVGSPAVVEGRQRFYTAVAETEVRTLALRGDDMFDVLEDRFDLARLMVRNLARRVAQHGDERGLVAEALEGSGPAFCSRCEQPLDLVQKIVFLKSTLLFAEGTVDELARLSQEVDQVKLLKGEVACREGEVADNFWLVLHGRVGPFGPRGLVALLAVLGQTRHPATLRAEKPSHLLRVPAEGFFDMLEDHFDMTRRLVRNLSRLARKLEHAPSPAGELTAES